MQHPSVLKHIRDILIMPFTITVVIPWLAHDGSLVLIRGVNIVLKLTAVAFLLVGLALFFWTVYLFNTIGKGTLAPWAPTQKLIVRGPYQYCRNPMITGVLFILIGETLFLNSVNLLIIAASFFIINTIYFMLKEEPDLYKRFGDEYADYKKHVPRWIPKLKPYNA